MLLKQAESKMEKDIISLYKELPLALKESHCQKAIGWHVNIHKGTFGHIPAMRSVSAILTLSYNNIVIIWHKL